ncbi:MAG: EAL domain-containing protein [bacterium]
MDKIKILIAENNTDIIEATKAILEYKGYIVIIAKSGLEAQVLIEKELPQLIILDLNLPDINSNEICRKLKGDSLSQIVPIIALTGKGELEEKVSILESGADDFITKPFDLAELVARVNTIIRRNYYNLDASPLTRLPGNQSIIRKIEEHIMHQDPFAVSYLDLNNFKAFNDKYGFSKGDDIIKRTAQIIVEVLKEIGESEDFVGHIGGDDFIVISRPNKIDQICLQIIDYFERTIGSFYDQSDVAQGGIVVEDRLGRVSTFPIMSISIGTITNDNTKLTHIGQISALASELKKYAKSFQGSAYVKDRRIQEHSVVNVDPSMSKKESVDRIGLLNNILEDRLIDILLQPIVALKTDEIFGHEAFCRGPKGTSLEYPDELFRVARIMDYVWELDRICMQKSLVVVRKLKKNIKYFINIAPETWLNPKTKGKDFFSNMILNPNNIFFEIQVNDLISDFNHYKQACDYFCSKGFGLAVDDVGDVGVKTLGHIKDLCPNYIKLDISLIRDIHKDSVKQNTVGILIDIFKNGEIKLIAEQVETAEEKEYLKKAGIDYAQGYLFARPEKLEE